MTAAPDIVQDGPRVLHELSFEVKSGERVGIGKHYRHHSDVPLTRYLNSRSHGKRQGQ